MDENKTIKLPVIKEDAIVSVEISNYFLKRIKSIYYYFFRDKDEKDVVEMLEKLSQSDEVIEGKFDEEPEVFHLITLAILINDIERKMNTEDLIEEMEFEYPKTQD